MAAKKRSSKKAPQSKRGKGSVDRLPDGKFVPGHSIKSPGNPNLRRMAELQAVVREAGTPERLRIVLDGLYDMATDSAMSPADRIAAARVYLERVAGKPKDLPSDPVTFDLPPIVGIADIPEAAVSILRAVAAGQITPDDAAKLTQTVELFRRGVADSDFDRRLQVLEGQGS